MIDQVKKVGDLIGKKKLFPLAQHLLNFLFVISISSFLFEKFYFKYKLLDITDYQVIYNFLIKGNFAVPISIFFIVWVLTFFISKYAFIVANSALSKRFREKINKIEAEILKEKSIQEPSSIKDDREKDWVRFLVEEIKASNTKKDLNRILAFMRKKKDECQDEFVVVLRGLIAVSIYFSAVPYFGYLLFSILIAAFLIYVFLLVSLYQLMELTPDIIFKIRKYYDDEKTDDVKSESTNIIKESNSFFSAGL